MRYRNYQVRCTIPYDCRVDPHDLRVAVDWMLLMTMDHWLRSHRRTLALSWLLMLATANPARFQCRRWMNRRGHRPAKHRRKRRTAHPSVLRSPSFVLVGPVAAAADDAGPSYPYDACTSTRSTFSAGLDLVKVRP